MNDFPELLTAEDLAKLLKMNKRTVLKLATNRQIPYIKLGYKTMRFVKDDVEKAILTKTIKQAK